MDDWQIAPLITCNIFMTKNSLRTDGGRRLCTAAERRERILFRTYNQPRRKGIRAEQQQLT